MLPPREELVCKMIKGKINFNKKGNLCIFKDLECYSNKILPINILALHQLNNLSGVHMEYQGKNEDAFYLRYENSKLVRFGNNGTGLYFYRNKNSKMNNKYKQGCIFAQYIQLVLECEYLLTKKELGKACYVRDLKEYLGWLLLGKLERIVKYYYIENAGIT